MSADPKIQNGKSYIMWKLIIFGAMGVCISWLAMLIVFGNFVDINPDLYARTFLVWRNKGGDAAMFEGRYKGYKSHDYKADKKFDEFLDFAQEKDGYIIAGNYPLHAPRGPEKLYTLMDDKGLVKELWIIEFNIKFLLNKDKFANKDAYRDSAIDAMKKKTYDQKFKSQWFINDKNIDEKDIVEAFSDGVNLKLWAKIVSSFYEILNNLVEGKKSDYKFKNGKVEDNLFADIRKLFTPLKYDDKKLREKASNFFTNMGTVKASPYETFTYSRLFNLFTFLTINHNFDYNTKIDKDNKPKEKELYSKEKAEIFAHIFAKVYEKPFTYSLPNPTFKDRLSQWFGTSQNISKIKDVKQESNIKKSLATMKQNVDAIMHAATSNQ